MNFNKVSTPPAEAPMTMRSCLAVCSELVKEFKDTKRREVVDREWWIVNGPSWEEECLKMIKQEITAERVVTTGNAHAKQERAGNKK